MSIEAMKQALEALDNLARYADTCELFLKETHPSKADALRDRVTNSIEAITFLRQAIEQAEKQEPWKSSDTAHRPGGMPQDFIQHEVDSPSGWSDWVCPKSDQYFIKCCDCGLVHEMQFKVVKYSEGDECEFVEDADTQAVFRARRASPQPQREWVGLMRGVRVDGDTVVITVKGGNESARQLCVELLKEKNT
jgi:hypothetical protein